MTTRPKDTFAEARDNDVQNLAEEMEAEIQQDSALDAEGPPVHSLWNYSTDPRGNKHQLVLLSAVSIKSL